jgi:penicillin-binding protein A
MNTPIRRLSVIVAIMFAALLVASSWIQFALAGDLRNQPGNRRALLASYGRERGSLLIDGTPIARSEKVDDEFQYLRTYPRGKLFSHVTGYYSFVYGPGGGLESAADDYLSGSSDSLFYRRLGDLITGKQPVGVSLELTLKVKAQQAAEQALGSQRGAVVALDPKTGAILALVSHPTYDPNSLAGHKSETVTKAWQDLIADPTRPLVNRAIAGDLYPPGSTFKVVTAAAALASGRYTETTKVESTATLKLPGTTSTLRNSGGGACNGGTADLTIALAKSCNTAFGAIGMDLGADTLNDQAAAFGFGKDLTVPMAVTPSRLGNIQGKPQEAFSAIGQQSVQVTPLQMAMVAAGVANKGVVMTPYLVARHRSADLQVLDQTSPTELSRAVDEDVAAALTRMMIQVVKAGTGTRAQIDGVTVAGKSGTAEHGTDANGVKRNPHAWFISFAPADDPKVAVAVVVEDGGDAGSEAAGGKVSAPIAREVMKAVIQ